MSQIVACVVMQGHMPHSIHPALQCIHILKFLVAKATLARIWWKSYPRTTPSYSEMRQTVIEPFVHILHSIVSGATKRIERALEHWRVSQRVSHRRKMQRRQCTKVIRNKEPRMPVNPSMALARRDGLGRPRAGSSGETSKRTIIGEVAPCRK